MSIEPGTLGGLCRPDLKKISIEEYVRTVLPESFALWGDKRSFDRYVDDFRNVANSTYAKRREFTIGMYEAGELVASCKNYDRELRARDLSLRAVGIGAVFTPPRLRGRGYATAMLGALLDDERAAGRDIAFLFSDIHPAFYARLGFVALPSRLITLRASSLGDERIVATPLEARDWPAIRRCFEALDLAQPWSLRRTPLVWDWMRNRWNAPVPEGSQAVHLVARRGRGVCAYVIGRRVPRQDHFVLDDFAFDGDEGKAAIGPLLRAAAGDLRRVSSWLPPPIARAALPAGSTRPRKDAILMIAPLSTTARSWWAANKDAILRARADPCWASDHI
jgi:predicted N-acetyltransferase YhbS